MSISSVALMPAIIVVKNKHSQLVIVEKPEPNPTTITITIRPIILYL